MINQKDFKQNVLKPNLKISNLDLLNLWSNCVELHDFSIKCITHTLNVFESCFPRSGCRLPIKQKEYKVEIAHSCEFRKLFLVWVNNSSSVVRMPRNYKYEQERKLGKFSTSPWSHISYLSRRQTCSCNYFIYNATTQQKYWKKIAETLEKDFKKGNYEGWPIEIPHSEVKIIHGLLDQL